MDREYTGRLLNTVRPAAASLRGVQWFTFADGKIKRVDEIVVSP